MMKHITGMIIGLLIVHASWAQDPKRDIVKMAKLYETAGSYSMSIEVRMFENNNDKQPVETYKGVSKKSASYFFSEMMGRISISNSDYFLAIDENRQMMVCTDPLPSTKKDAFKESIIDTSFLAGQSYRYAYTNGKEKCIDVNGDGLVYDRIEVVIDTKTGQMTSLSYFYNKAQDVPYSKVTILFTDVKLNVVIPASEFSSAKYLTVKKDALVPQGKWALYKVIDQRKKK